MGTLTLQESAYLKAKKVIGATEVSNRDDDKDKPPDTFTMNKEYE
jgi:hypothetical protein